MIERLISAFTWGIGLSSGAAIGLMLFYWLKFFSDVLTKREGSYRSTVAHNAAAIEALKERNKLTEDTNEILSAMVDAIDELDKPAA